MPGRWQRESSLLPALVPRSAPPAFIPSNPQLIHRLVVSAVEMSPRMMIVGAVALAMSARCRFFVG